jgi:prolyl 3-hydroxylase /prolyl 3,4-dihydroxylase
VLFIGDHRDGYHVPLIFFLVFFSTFMAPARERSPSRNSTDPKRIKTTHVSPLETPSPPAAATAAATTAIAPSSSLINNTNTGLTSQFANEIFNHNYIAKLHTDYLDSNPFKHAVVEKLFQDELLVKVKDECLRLNFTQKETDIFKVCSFFTLKMDLTHGAFDRSSRRAISPH